MGEGRSKWDGSCADFVDLDIDPTLLIDLRELRMAAAGQKEFLDRVLMLACAFHSAQLPDAATLSSL